MNTETYRVGFSTRGRVTIPVAIRRKLGLKCGSKVMVSMKMNGDEMPPALVLKPVGIKRH